MKQRLLFALLWCSSLGLTMGSLWPGAAAAAKAPQQPISRSVLDERTLVVYPNPSTGIVHLTINGLEGRKVEVTVLNVIGTVMYRETLSDLNERSTRTLDLSRFANGLYYVKLEADNSSQLCKLVIR
ncbi:T9SS type A sorting domain-containing protein [Hymenobacter sp. HMF4947]|uniref:T9SS type A sorting domain-containing protein n=1 Tax=Hymenobacter ginkgonis TaxID=2682976 RepID=A0A7K1TD32_9BACT|nr:T9SS type A sorting domain-containing protein [Hymenobacter ginkgonis]MVN76300.1 T9SS type A sorting domain-containing protein [Hymenobacter ginkgonis]